jgi:signal transduction histidine kinase
MLATLDSTPARADHPALSSTLRPLIDEAITRGEAFAADGAVAAPLRVEGAVAGAVGLLRGPGRGFTADEVRIVQAFAQQAALTLEAARVSADAIQRLRGAEELARVAQVLTESLDMAAVSERVVESVLSLFRANSSALYQAAADGSLAALAWGGQGRTYFEPGQTFARGVGVAGRALTTGRAVWSADVLRDDRITLTADMRQRIVAAGNRAVLAVPLRAKGRFIGALSIADQGVRPFTAAEVALLQTFADQAALALENARLYSEAQQAYEELSRAQAQLVRSETLRAIGEVAAGAAHHLNNLLAVILARTQLMLRKLTVPEMRRPLEVVERAATDAADVVRRIRTFSRAHPTPTLESVDLNQLLHEVVELTRPRWRDEPQRRGVSFEIVLDTAPAVPAVAGEAAALREVLVNLLLNAVDAMPVGGTVRMRTWADADAVHCAVTDTGTGMTPEVQRRAFDPFFTTKGPKSTGLGLSVNDGIIRAHGGALAIDSEPGRGTTVRFHLPIARTFTTARPQPPVIVGESSARLRILLVDDETEVRAALAEMLREEGHQVAEAEDGPAGLARLGQGPACDLMLTDLGMPGLTGWEVVNAAKRARPGLIVGLVTGWGDDLDGKPGPCAPPDFVLAKPITQTALRLALARVALQRSEARA